MASRRKSLLHKDRCWLLPHHHIQCIFFHGHHIYALWSSSKIEYNPIPDVIQASKETGINVHFWYSIFEDDHGGAYLCNFASDHPEYWQMDRDGRTYRGTLDFFFEEVRSYKLAVIDELLAHTGVEGICSAFLPLLKRKSEYSGIVAQSIFSIFVLFTQVAVSFRL